MIPHIDVEAQPAWGATRDLIKAHLKAVGYSPKVKDVTLGLDCNMSEFVTNFVGSRHDPCKHAEPVATVHFNDGHLLEVYLWPRVLVVDDGNDGSVEVCLLCLTEALVKNQ